MNHSYERKDFRILVSGYINVNVVDGSAFFLAGVCSMLAGVSSVSVTLLTANPVRKTEVLDEVLYYENVSILDPFASKNRALFSNAPLGERMQRREYARAIGEIEKDFDSILLRDTETAFYLVKEFPEVASKLSVYVTGITTVNESVDDDIVQMLRALRDSGVKFLCQTKAILQRLSRLLPSYDQEKLALLPPHVPDAEGTFEELYHYSKHPNRFVYTGKFFKAWNTDLILASFKSVAASGNCLTLDIAGDQFRRSEEDPYFVDNNRWLMDSTPGVTWHGRVPRLTSRSLISAAQIGVGWRAESMNNSSELSTKILEYGALARPSIINRTSLHEQLLGDDYPLFANSISEFKELLLTLPDRPNDVEEAAKRCFNIAKDHSYSSIRGQLLRHLGNTPPEAFRESSFALSSKQPHMSQIPDAGLVNVHGGICWVDPAIEGRDPVAQQLSELAQDENLAQKLPTLLRKRASEIEVRQNRIVQESPQALTSATRIPEGGLTEQPIGKNQSAISKLAHLREEKRVLEERLATSERRLDALRKSKLGRVQVEIWKNRRGLHALPKENIKERANALTRFSRHLRHWRQNGS